MTYDDIKRAVAAKGYAFFDAGAFNLKIIGVRSANPEPESFDDRLIVAYRDHTGAKRVQEWPITCDPGVTSLQASGRHRDGAAILLPGQYRGMYQIGIHGRSWPSGGYRALEQRRPARYHRDDDGDAQIDPGSRVFEGNIKTNIHHQGRGAADDWVGSASAGCQVFRRATDFDQLMALCDAQVRAGHGSTFTYTLLEEADLC
jgi:hypothetical protein